MIFTDEEEEDAPPPINGSGAYFTQYVSSRRPITEEEKKAALISASCALNSESLMLVMKPSHVYKRFFLVNYEPFLFSIVGRRGVCFYLIDLKLVCVGFLSQCLHSGF